MIRLVLLLSLLTPTKIFSGPLYDHVFGNPTKLDKKEENVQRALSFLRGIIDHDDFEITDALPILRDCYHYLWLLPSQNGEDEITYNNAIQLCKKVRLEILHAGLNNNLQQVGQGLIAAFKSFLAVVTSSLVLKSFYIIDEFYLDDGLKKILSATQEDYAFYEKIHEGPKNITLVALEDEVYIKYFLQLWRRCDALSRDIYNKISFYGTEISRNKMKVFFTTLEKALKEDIKYLPSLYPYAEEADKVLSEHHYVSDQFMPSDDEARSCVKRATVLFARILKDIKSGRHRECAEEVKKIADDFVVTAGGASAAPPDFLEIKADSDSTPDEVPGWMASLSKFVWGDTKT